MTQFKEEHPNVRFELFQGQYDNINKWIQDGTIDLGFISSARTKDLAFDTLYKDSMVAVLPMNHLLAKEKALSLDQLTNDTFILLDEGLYNTTLEAFNKKQLKPSVEYVIYDDYSIISMVRNCLGISTLFRNVIKGFEDGLSIHEIDEPIERTICLARRKDKALSYAAEKFRLLTVRELNEI